MGLGYVGMGQSALSGSHQQSGDLLAMISKSSGAGQLGGLSSLSQGYGSQQQPQSLGQSSSATQNQGQVCEAADSAPPITVLLSQNSNQVVCENFYVSSSSDTANAEESPLWSSWQS